jgi:choline dehydrogenase-like flavoprotein
MSNPTQAADVVIVGGGSAGAVLLAGPGIDVVADLPVGQRLHD